MKKKDFTILCVDDHTTNLEVLSTILTKEGYKLALAQSGKEALEIVNKEDINLILLDIMMPGEYDGFKLCEVLKQEESTAGIPILFLTARNKVDDLVKGLQLGGNDYITKPFQAEELLARVKTHIKLSYVQHQLKDRVKYLEKSRFELMHWLHNLAKTVE